VEHHAHAALGHGRRGAGDVGAGAPQEQLDLRREDRELDRLCDVFVGTLGVAGEDVVES
jgi:hypothetical protein